MLEGSNILPKTIIANNNIIIDGAVCLTNFHKNNTEILYPMLKEKLYTINNGINPQELKFDSNVKIKNKFVWTSAAYRGLEILLDLWPKILEKLPDATLDISSYHSFPNNEQETKMKVIIDNHDSISHLGKLNTEELYQLTSTAEYWLYTNTFAETSCITGMEMLMNEVICLYYPVAGLVDTIGDYGIKVERGNELETILNLSEERKTELRKNGKEYALTCSWENRAKEWNTLVGLDNLLYTVDNYNNYQSIKFFTYPSDKCIISKVISKNQIWEPHMHIIFEKYINKESIVLEGGCHIGTHTLKLALLGKQLLAFEPLNKSHAILYDNIKINNIDNVTLYSEGLSNDPGEAYFETTQINNPGGSALSNNPMGVAEYAKMINSSKYPVKLITIDSLELNKLDFIKLDVEGYEINVIEGAINTIKRCKPIITLESWNNHFGEVCLQHTKNTFKILLDNGYTMEHIEGPDFLFLPPVNLCNLDNKITDKNTQHSYLPLYDTLLSPIRDTANNILEVGIGDFTNHNGGSLLLWHNYFTKAIIYGIDILPVNRVLDEVVNNKSIKIYTEVDAYDKSFVLNNLQGKKFDFLIEDGPHTLDSQEKFIELYSPLLSENGILIIEDIQDINFLKNLKNKTPEYLKKYIKSYDLRNNKKRYDDIVFTIDKINIFPPIIIICYNNYKYVDNTIKQLLKINKYFLNYIQILNNCSTCIDTINYLQNVKCKVIYNTLNSGPWICDTNNVQLYNSLPDKFILTDPDLEFNENLPSNFIEILITLSDKYNCFKIGFALDISENDKFFSSEYYQDKNIFDWETQFWKNKILDADYNLYEATIDTTFCLINKNNLDGLHLRIANNFTAKHLPWYKDNKIYNIYENYLNNISSTTCSFDPNRMISNISKVIINYIDNKYLKIHKNDEFFFIENRVDNSNLNFWKGVYTNWEMDTFNIFDRFLCKNKIFIDIGGWIGTTCMYAARKSKYVYSIEADYYSFVDLSTNCKINCENNYTLINKAIYNIDDIEIKFGKNKFLNNSKINDSTSQIYDDNEIIDKYFVVKTITLQCIIDNYNIIPSEISLIKVDIEGSEEYILNDLYKIYTLYNTPLYISFHYEWWKDKNLNRFKFLTELHKHQIKTNPFCSILFN